MAKNRYNSPFSARYASEKMQYLFSEEMKFTTWRKLWVALAESEQQLGLPVTDQQIEQMRQHISDINYEEAEARERVVRHDVMSHVYAYGLQCPDARGIIHLGATSCYVGDNTDVIIMREALRLVRTKLLNVLEILSGFAMKYKDMPTLGYTHYQPAQPTTVGKRAALWLQDFYNDFLEIDHIIASLKLLGCKGTTGTQASFVELFDGDLSKVDQLDPLIAQKMDFPACVDVSGQTYSRKTDSLVLNGLGGIAQTAMKMATDLRLLQHMKEIEEPFEKNQIGSSAMAYKRNPMRSERICALSRYLIADVLNPAITAGTQWLERSLDDSANRRISIAEGFLAADGILDLCINVTDGLVVYPAMVRRHLEDELPFMATENILMEAVKKGGDRQVLHERIRTLSMEAASRVKKEGLNNDLLERIENDPAFGLSAQEIRKAADPAGFTGAAAHQTERFINTKILPLLEENKEQLGVRSAISI